MKKILVPVHTRILVLPIEDKADDRTPAGLIIPDSAKKEPDFVRGIVISVGDDVTMLEPQDLVYYGPYSATLIELAGRDHVLMEEKQVLLVEKEVEDTEVVVTETPNAKA